MCSNEDPVWPKTNKIISEAIDIDGVNFIYEETDIEIEVYDEDNADAYL